MIEGSFMKRVYAPVGSWFASPFVEKRGNKFFIVFEGELGTEEQEVSGKFYQVWCEEFGKETPEEKTAEEYSK